ncbi:MAG: PilZ domain-containing protein [Treponema sp.]|nr:PilZ domain-containing protein [Treponema sp.]
MAFVTTQTINRYYDCYRDTEIVFSKEIIHTLKMDPRQIYIKSGGLQWPCIVNSSSFNQAKIILGTNGGAYATLSKKDPDPVSLKFSFYNPDGQLMSFFVNAKVDIIQPYMNSTDLSLITIQYTQRPPDDLIVMLGSLVEANMNAIRRKEDRIHITQNSMRKLGLQRKELTVSIQNIQRNCILQDLSFGGAKIVLLGLSKFLLQKEAFLQLEFDDPHEMMIIKGIIVSTTPVEGRSDLIGASIQFQEDSISLAYKIRINNYISTMRKDELNANKDEQQGEVQKVSEAK